MSNIEVAKELLKKAIALNDSELMEMANKLLEPEVTYGSQNHYDNVYTDCSGIVPKANWECTSCNNHWYSLTKPKSCKNCKKRKHIIEFNFDTWNKNHDIFERNSEKINDGGIFRPGSVYTGQGQGKRVRINPDTGLPDGTYGRSEPIKVGQNKFVDTGKDGQDGREFDQKYGNRFHVSERSKPAATQKTVKCEYCKTEFAISPILYSVNKNYHVCNKCVQNRGKM